MDKGHRNIAQTVQQRKHSALLFQCAYAAAAVALSCFAVSCGKYDISGMFASKSASSDERFAQSVEYNKEVGNIEIKAASDEYGICVFSDAHIEAGNQAAIAHLDSLAAQCLRGWVKTDEGAYVGDDSKSASGKVNLTKGVPGEFTAVISLGDMISGTGNWDCFEQHISPVSEALPFFTTAGNHELNFGQWNEYHKRFGSSTYTVTVRTPEHCDLFIILDSGDATLGKDQRAWLEATLQSATAITDNGSSNYRNIAVFTHTNFFSQSAKPGISAKYALEETYDLTDTFSRYGVNLVLTGHSHRQHEVYFRGSSYYTTAALQDGSYIVLDIGAVISIHSQNTDDASISIHS